MEFAPVIGVLMKSCFVVIKPQYYCISLTGTLYRKSWWHRGHTNCTGACVWMLNSSRWLWFLSLDPDLLCCTRGTVYLHPHLLSCCLFQWIIILPPACKTVIEVVTKAKGSLSLWRKYPDNTSLILSKT